MKKAVKNMRPLVLAALLVCLGLIPALQAAARTPPAPTGKGAIFWSYVSPQNNTAQRVTKWKITISQGSWSDSIESSNPNNDIHTNGLSGTFKVKVTASGPQIPEKNLQPGPNCNADIGCNDNCAAMVVIIAAPDGKDANYCTTWNAVCN